MIDVQKLRAWDSGGIRQRYTQKDTILYALGLGIGADPVDPAQLRFTYERDLIAVPTMAAVLASPGFWMRDRPELGIDFTKLVHGEQSVVLHRPLAPAADVSGRSRVVRVVDKGVGRGAVVHVEKELFDVASGAHLATTEQVLMLRADGGFAAGTAGDEPAPAAPAAPAPPPPPDTAPDLVVDLPTRPDAALLYRLSGDLNPLHADPAFAVRAGFARPILHGLATYGVACHGLIRATCADDPARLRAIRARLSSPVYPGETLRLEVWRLADDELAFRGRLVERDVVVLSHGRARVTAAARP